MTNYQGYGQQQPQAGYQNQQGGAQKQNNGFDNHAEMQLIGRMVADPTSEQKNGSYLAQGKIAINHRTTNGEAKTDYWFVEVWGNQNSMTKHNYLTQHCPKGRKVFITGIPELRQRKKDDGSYTYFPTIKISTLVGLDGGPAENQGGGQQAPAYNQAPPQQPNGQYAPPAGQYAPPTGMPAYGQQQPPAQPAYNQAPPAPTYNQAPPAAFPPNVPGAGFPPQQPMGGAPAGPVGVPVGAPAPMGAPNGYPQG